MGSDITAAASPSTLLAALRAGLPCGKLIVKLATTEAERTEVFQLRYEVFNEELGEGIPENAATGLDRDAFDDYCDHLMVMSNGDVVGTYRLLPGPQRPPTGFYTETEFDLAKLTFDPDLVVELGRGCISPEFRKQTTLMALFWGLVRYMKAREARHLLGCASLAPMSANDAEASFEVLTQQGIVDLSMGLLPREENRFSGDASAGMPQIPQLVKFYVQFGAKVVSRPAYDPIFRVFDLLMAFDMEHLSEWGTELLTRFDKRSVAGAAIDD